jgi:hypothetical protein
MPRDPAHLEVGTPQEYGKYGKIIAMINVGYEIGIYVTEQWP